MRRRIRVELATLVVYRGADEQRVTVEETDWQRRAQELYASGADLVFALGPRIYGPVERKTTPTVTA